jgi:septation ring formation regulator EzrA
MIDNPTWKNFSADFIGILISSGVSSAGATRSVELLKEMPKDVKNSPEVLTQLSKYLELWKDKTKNKKNLGKAYTKLKKKIDKSLAKYDQLYNSLL